MKPLDTLPENLPDALTANADRQLTPAEMVAATRCLWQMFDLINHWIRNSDTKGATVLSANAIFALCLFGSPCFADTPLRNWPLVSKGEKDANVRAVQLLLAAHGYKVSADGGFGAVTQKALRQFQSAHSLVATGETNNPTWEALIVTVQQNNTGPAVRAAQYELRNEGYAVAASGIFDAQMKASVQKFQKQTGHTADGVIGRRTWYELVGGDDSPGD